MRFARSVLLLLMVAGLSTSSWAASPADTIDVPGQEHAARDVTISGWIAGSPYHPDNGDVYFTVTNNSREPHLINGVDSPSCKSIVARHSEQEATSQTADLLTHFTLPANVTIVFPEQGYHLVCLDMAKDVPSGTKVPFVFHFLGGDTLRVTFEMRARG